MVLDFFQRIWQTYDEFCFFTLFLAVKTVGRQNFRGSLYILKKNRKQLGQYKSNCIYSLTFEKKKKKEKKKEEEDWNLFFFIIKKMTFIDHEYYEN